MRCLPKKSKSLYAFPLPSVYSLVIASYLVPRSRLLSRVADRPDVGVCGQVHGRAQLQEGEVVVDEPPFELRVDVNPAADGERKNECSERLLT